MTIGMNELNWRDRFKGEILGNNEALKGKIKEKLGKEGSVKIR